MTATTGGNKGGGISPVATLSFGALSGFASCVLLQPFDLLKTRLQQLDTSSTPLARGDSRTQKLRAVIRDTVQTQGYKGLWRGTAPTIVRNVPGVALYFYSVSSIRAFASTHQIPIVSVAGSHTQHASGSTSTMAKLSTMGNLLTGAVARVTVGLILSPVTVVKARFEVSLTQARLPAPCAALNPLSSPMSSRPTFHPPPSQHSCRPCERFMHRVASGAFSKALQPQRCGTLRMQGYTWPSMRSAKYSSPPWLTVPLLAEAGQAAGW